MQFYKILTFTAGCAVYGVAAFLFGGWLFQKLVRPFDCDQPWKRREQVALFVYLAVVLTFAIAMGIFTTRQVRPSNNPTDIDIPQFDDIR